MAAPVKTEGACVKGNPNSQTALARDFGVSVPTIQKILKGEHYAVV